MCRPALTLSYLARCSLFCMKLVVVDRDGVINADSPSYIRSTGDVRLIPGSLEGLAAFTQAGYCVAVATNQSGLSRGYLDVDELNRIHALLSCRAAALGGRIDAFAFCPHGPSDGCACRKPEPGLLVSLARRFSASLSSTPFIGDSLRDLESAQAVGAKPVLVLTGNGESTARILPPSLAHVDIYRDLGQASNALLAG